MLLFCHFSFHTGLHFNHKLQYIIFPIMSETANKYSTTTVLPHAFEKPVKNGPIIRN